MAKERDTVSTVEAREHLSDIVSRAGYGKERVILSRRGKPIAAVVSMQDLEALEAMEAKLDAEAYRRAKAAFVNSGDKPISWKKIKKELGL
jgi:prevent-host-death family protein